MTQFNCPHFDACTSADMCSRRRLAGLGDQPTLNADCQQHQRVELDRRMRGLIEQMQLIADSEKKAGEHTAFTVWSMAAEMLQRELDR